MSARTAERFDSAVGAADMDHDQVVEMARGGMPASEIAGRIATRAGHDVPAYLVTDWLYRQGWTQCTRSPDGRSQCERFTFDGPWCNPCREGSAR